MLDILQKQILTKRNSGRNVQPQFSLNLHCLTGTRSDTNKIGRFSIKLSLKISICENNKCQISNHWYLNNILNSKYAAIYQENKIRRCRILLSTRRHISLIFWWLLYFDWLMTLRISIPNHTSNPQTYNHHQDKIYKY